MGGKEKEKTDQSDSGETTTFQEEKRDRLQGPFYSGLSKNKIKLKRVQKVDGQQSKGIGKSFESPI